MKGGLFAGTGLLLLAACTAPIPADVELVSVQVAAQSDTALSPGVQPAGPTSASSQRLLKVAFASRVNLVRFVTVNGYSLAIKAGFCDGEESIAASGIYWRGTLLVPGGPDPIQAENRSRDALLDYIFFMDAEEAAARAESICFKIAGGNADRGYRSNTVAIPQIEIALAVQP